MKVDVYNLAGEKTRTVELPAQVFEAPINVDLMHQAYVRQMANARLGTHATKNRAAVAGGGRKPWRQKGTGRARQGSTRSPIWVGGGKVHTPQPRDYTLRMPKKMRRAALRSALSVKAADAEIVVVEGFDIQEPKTRVMAEILSKLVGENSALILLPQKDERYDRVMRSTANLPDAKVLLAGYLNIRDLLKYEKLILPIETVDALVAHLG